MSGSASGSRRLALAYGLAMGATAGIAALRAPTAAIPRNPPLDLAQLFPQQAGDWRLDRHTDLFIRPTDNGHKVFDVYDQVLERIYVGADGHWLMLCVAYGGRQTDGLHVHRPENCYRSEGFEVSGLTRLDLTLAGHAVAASRLHAQRPGRSEPITYWTVFGESVENDPRDVGWLKLRAGLQGEVLDGMLVRISSIDSDVPRAHQLHARFAEALVSAIDPRYRSRVIGA